MRAQRRVALNPLEERAAMDTGESSESRRHKVLVVDDDERLLALVRLALSKNGVDVETAVTPAEALEVFEERAPDLVVLDVIMPDLSGWEVLRRIRESSDVAVMLLSGRDSEVDKARGLDLGADDYLTKPFSFMEFEARVRALLRRVGPGERGEI
ncbi:MAG: response regulator transcription factor [Actinomycetota bacterium]|nr:response regulator transcription factor [Actinomycetota bacterium]